MEGTYGAIVLGLGAMGSATAYHLARRGVRVLGLDAFGRGHTNGSSHGRSRIIREAYFEAPEYVPLVQRAYTLWRELEAEAGRELLRITGGLTVGAPEGATFAGALASARRHGLPHEELGPDEVAARFPGFRLPGGCGPSTSRTRASSTRRPASWRTSTGRRGTARRSGTTSRRGAGPPTAAARGSRRTGDLPGRPAGDRRRAVGGGGAGRPRAAADGAARRQRPLRPGAAGAIFAPERCPVYILGVPEGDYYGFPALPGQGVKFGRHDVGEVCTPDTIRRAVDESEIAALRAVLDRYLPGAAGDVLHTLTCMYTNTPDRDFVLDHHPAHPQVIYGCGFSGHGFKFASVIGEILADLAIDGRTRHAIGFLAASRFSPRVEAPVGIGADARGEGL